MDEMEIGFMNFILYFFGRQALRRNSILNGIKEDSNDKITQLENKITNELEESICSLAQVLWLTLSETQGLLVSLLFKVN